MLIAVTFVVMYLLCVDEYYRVNVLRWTGIDLIVGGNYQFYHIMKVTALLYKTYLFRGTCHGRTHHFRGIRRWT